MVSVSNDPSIVRVNFAAVTDSSSNDCDGRRPQVMVVIGVCECVLGQRVVLCFSWKGSAARGSSLLNRWLLKMADLGNQLPS